MKGKFLEQNPKLPSFSSFKKSGGFAYEIQEVKAYEILILKGFDYEINFYTSFDILNLIRFCGIYFDDSCCCNEYSEEDPINIFNEYFKFAFFLLEEITLSLKISEFSKLEISCICLLMSSCFKFEMIDIGKLLYGEIINFDSSLIETLGDSYEKIER